MYPQSHFINAFINYSPLHQAEQSLQRQSNKQPPKTSFVGIKTNINKAEITISRLSADSVASNDNSMNLNICTATEKGGNIQSQLRLKEDLFQLFFNCPLYVIVFIYVFNMNRVLQKGLVI